MAAQAIPFSYAQAARGMSSAVASPKESSTHASGSSTPSKHQDQSLAQLPPPAVLSEEKERVHKQGDARKFEHAQKESAMDVSQIKALHDTSAKVNGIPTPPSPEYGMSSLSTLAKDDDASSIQQKSSESTWDSKSQVSNPADNGTDSAATVMADAIEEKMVNGKAGEKETDPTKPLQEAPPPVVNIWQVRADAAKAKAAAQPTAPKAAAPALSSSNQKGTGDKENNYPRQKARASAEDNAPHGKDRKQGSNATSRTTGEERSHGRRDLKNQTDGEKDRRNTGKSTDRQANVPIVPPSQDVALWPTPDTIKDGDRKKSEKSDKERHGGSSAKPHSKSDWVHVPFTPSVVFNTPLPNSNSRRGGRGGNRGGRDAGGRGASSTPNGGNEKSATSTSSHPDGEHSKRGKGDGSSAKYPLGKGRKGAAAETTVQKESGTAGSTSQPPVTDQATSSEQRAAKTSDQDSKPASTQADGQQNGHHTKAANRGRQNRRFDGPAAPYPNEKRKEGDVATSNGSSGGSQARRASAAINVDENGERKSPVGDNYAQSKASPSERRNGTYPPYSTRERGRGGMRGSRNGSHGHQQSHHGPHPQYSNGQMGAMNSSTPYSSIPTSPTGFRQDSQSSFFGQPQTQHSRSYRNPGRSQSIPVEPTFGRVPSYGGAPQTLAPIQTFAPPMFDYQGMPVGTFPYSSYVDQAALFNAVLSQLEYYFSMDNLCKDTYLRSHMDAKGFVFLTVVAEFNRLKSLTTDIELLKLACYYSRTIEYLVGTDGKDRIRTKDGWEKWVFEKQKRDDSVQNAGDEELLSPPLPQPQGFEMSGFVRTNPLPSPTSPGYGPVYASLNGMSVPVSTNPALAAHAAYPFAPQTNNLPAAVNGTNGVPLADADGSASAQQPDLEMDSFSDEQIQNLSIIIKTLDPSVEPPKASLSRVPSGLTDSNEASTENAGTEERRLPSRLNGVTSPANSEGQRAPSRDLAPNSTSFNLENGVNPARLYWIRDNEVPSPSLPSNSSCETYTELRAKALHQRHSTACPYDMIVLYQFWCHFLVKNFNKAMYNEFRSFAFEDAHNRTSDTGLRNLIKYYGEALAGERPIRERIARHYVDYVRTEADPDRPAFKQLRAAWRNGALNLRNRKKISQYVQMDEQLMAALER